MTAWYHGTRRGFRRGGYVAPRVFHDGPPTAAPLKSGAAPDPEAHRYTYLTTSKTLAWVYAWHAPGRGKPKVLTVEPRGMVTRDPEHSHRMEAYRCDGWLRVIGVDTVPAVSEADARDGWVDADSTHEVPA